MTGDGARGGAVRVLVVDDHPVVRRGLRTMLEGETWVDGVVEAATCAEAVSIALTEPVGVVAMDVALPDGDGVEATRRIVQARPETRVLMVTMSDDEDVVSRSLRAGARGYVLKDTDPDVIVDALRTVAGGGLVLGPRIGPQVLTSLRRQPVELPPPFDRLTPRERDILRRLAAGDTNARIARHFGLSEKTVRNQLSAVFAKLGVADRVQAALLARDAGLTG
ncbi:MULTISPECIES: response regulator transcription factor [unclassified Micromonospora]|uniref:response regulator n=1 Tax=unclassified Micromonospora TaxID=2617518 RepID=UPI001C5F1C0C|nr:response regulator transcription factor [Micromonospora sp. RL09-050-HVF-A]MBW4705507.1 response regulator transcription factor [Micromonospora sp. RL09-050-HVF-A]